MGGNGGSQTVACHQNAKCLYSNGFNDTTHCWFKDTVTYLFVQCYRLNLDWTFGTIPLCDGSTMVEKRIVHTRLPRVSNGHGWAQIVVLCFYSESHENAIFMFLPCRTVRWIKWDGVVNEWNLGCTLNTREDGSGYGYGSVVSVVLVHPISIVWVFSVSCVSWQRGNTVVTLFSSMKPNT